MLEVFDGFVAAVNTETKIPFRKEHNGNYISTIKFKDDQEQKVLVFLDKDEAGDSTVNYYSKICDMDEHESEHQSLSIFRDALSLNISLTYGAIAFVENSLVIHQTYFLQNLDPQRFIKSLLYVAAKANELKEVFNK